MPVHSTKPGFATTTLDLEPPNPIPDVSDGIQQSLAYLMVWDTSNNRWVPLTGNVDGASLVTFAAPQSQAPRYGTVVIPVAAGIIFNSNPLRKQLIIEMTTTAPVWLGFSSALTGANGYQCGPGTYFSIDNYTDVIWGISPFGIQNARYIEV